MADYNTSQIEVYDMTSQPRGICLIINNMKFQRSSELEAGKADKENLHNTFEKLGFKVNSYFENLKAEQMRTKLEKVAQEDHSSHSCFVCCITSHGTEKGIVGTDENIVNIRDLTSHLCASKCKSLAGKPKLFFVDACRGCREQTGSKASLETSELDNTVPSTQEGPIPDEADFLLSYATPMDYRAYEHSDKSRGSRFFSRLTEYLDRYADFHDILQILTMVNNAVSEDVADKLQTPAAEFTLRKRLYLGFQHIRVLMVGPSVSGKSSVANAILGQGKFAVSLPGKTTKKQSDWQHINRKGRRIEVTELPGFVGKMEDCLHHEFNKAMLTTLPGPHVVFLCYGADSGFSVNEDHYKWLREFLADDFDKFVVLVFSGLLEHAFADEVSKKLVDDLNTRRRKVVFSANIVAEEQQNLMLETVCRVVSENNGRFFSNNKVESLEKEMQSLRRERAPYDIKRSIVDGEDLGLKCLTNPPSPLSSFLDQCKSQPVLLKAIALTLAVATIVLPQWGPGWLSRQLSR